MTNLKYIYWNGSDYMYVNPALMKMMKKTLKACLRKLKSKKKKGQKKKHGRHKNKKR